MLEKQMKVRQSDKFGVCAWSGVSFGRFRFYSWHHEPKARMDPCLWRSCAPFVAYNLYRLTGVTADMFLYDVWRLLMGASNFNVTVLCEIEHLSFFNLIFLHAVEIVWEMRRTLCFPLTFSFIPLDFQSVGEGDILMHLSNCRLLGTSMCH